MLAQSRSEAVAPLRAWQGAAQDFLGTLYSPGFQVDAAHAKHMFISADTI